VVVENLIGKMPKIDKPIILDTSLLFGQILKKDFTDKKRLNTFSGVFLF